MVSTETKPAVSRAEDAMVGLDGSGAMLPQQSPHNSDKERRRSYETTTTTQTYPPHDSPWQGFGFGLDGGADATDTSNMHSFFNLQNPPSHPPSSTLPSAPFSPHAPWPTQNHSGDCTPTAGFDFQTAHSTNFAQPPHSAPAGFDVSMSNSSHPMPAGFTPTSPQNKEGWFGAPTESVDFPSMPAQRPLGQAIVTSTNILRRDGIRKKNARFEIPVERNLRTIDQLINQSTDEQEIKELKQQKRLLRNRQAALDSRQRKKQHTERLEEEKKHYTAVISDLEDALADMKLQETEWHRQKDQWVATQQQYQNYVERLSMEKDELLRRHTIETGDLRKKNAILMEQLQRLESTAMSTAPSSAGFSAEFSEFDHLTMNSWDNFSLSNDFSLEPDTRTDMQMPVVSKKEMAKAAPAPAEDKNLSSGILLMLLLCGAWVVSNNSKSAHDFLPSVSEEIKTASAAVLDTLYKDSGISLQGSTGGRTPRPNTAVDNFEMAGISQSSLDSLHHRLITPSERQLHEQAFSLTPRQYNDLSSGMGPYPPSSSGYPAVQPPAPSLGEALAAEPPTTGQGGPAETYTRSLLKSKVSSQVLREFARMVATTRPHGPVQEWKAEPVD